MPGAEGYINDPPAAVDADSTNETNDSVIALLKAIKNLQIDLTELNVILAGAVSAGKVQCDTELTITGDGLATETTLDAMATDVGTMQTDLATVTADIALMKADLAEVLQKTQSHVAIDFSNASAQTIIAAPGASNRIRLTRLSLMSGSNPQANVEIALKSGATTIETVRGDAMVFDYPEHRNLGTNEAFVVQCTTADRVIGGVDYYVEAV
ncbi:MAG: hypothetical protein WC343_15250 [Bacilli bacterium]|jgi:hypothetical protein